MTELFKARYAQAIPGINRTDDSIQFSRAEKCIPHFGDGLSQPDKLTSDTAVCRGQGRDNKVWCETLNRVGEGGVRNAFRARENKLRQWREHLNKEVDRLSSSIEEAVSCQKLLQKKVSYFSGLSDTSDATAEFRRRLEDHDPSDTISNLIREEQEKIRKADGDMKRHLEEMKDCERRLQSARSALMSEVEAKSLTLNIGKRCQHAEPLLGFPHIPADHPSDQIYHPNSEEDWERHLVDKVQNSVSVRKEASDCCDAAAACVRQNEGETGTAWYRTSKALKEAVQEEEKEAHNIHNLLKRINQDLSSASQRIAYQFNDLKVQDRVRHTNLWRLQTMTYRPGPDHIRDGPIRKLDEELRNVERRTQFTSDNLTHSKDLLQKLEEERGRQTLRLERLSRRLFVQRENCLGIRRALTVEGSTLDPTYISES